MEEFTVKQMMKFVDFAEVEKYSEHLSGGGYFCLFVPARKELFSSIDERFGHCRRYDRKELRQLLELAGYRVLKIHYFNLAGYFLWWINFVLLHRKTFNPKIVKINDRYIFPGTHFVERHLGAPLIGQSLVVIAQHVSSGEPKYA